MTRDNHAVLRAADLTALGWRNTDTQEWAPDPNGVLRPLPPKDIYAHERTRSAKPSATTPQRRRRWPWRRNEDT